jgi:heptosyltransferase III
LTKFPLGKSAADDASSAVLFVCAGQIGDCVLATGILGHVVETRPEARFTIAAAPSALPLFRYVPRLDQLIPMEKRQHHLHWLDLYRAVAPVRWDLVVCLRGPILPWLLRARERCATTRSNQHDHYVIRLARLFGLDPPPAPRVWLSAEDSREAAVIMGNGPVLGLAPGANWPAKQWPADRFAEVARRLTASDGVLAGARVAVFGLPAQQQLTATTLAAIPPSRRIEIADGRNLAKVAACVSRTHLFIGNDSGLMHIAAAARVPTLGLFGPTQPITHGPWGDLTAVVRTATSHEELLRRLGEGAPIDQLMNSLTVDHVEQSAIDLLQRSASANEMRSPADRRGADRNKPSQMMR